MDLFTETPRSIGYGNAMFLADLAEHFPETVMRRKYKAGEYPDLHLPSVPGWWTMAGRV